MGEHLAGRLLYHQELDAAVRVGGQSRSKSDIALLRPDIDRLYKMWRAYFLAIVGGFFALLAAIIATGLLG